MERRKNVFQTIDENPDWPISKVAKFTREELHLTLTDMSKLTKIAVPTLQKLEQPEGNPTLSTVMKFLNAFGLKLCIKVK